MVSGFISCRGATPRAWGVNIARPGSQTNWTLTFTSIPQSAAATSVFVTVSDANGAPLAIATNVPFSQIASGGTSGYHAMYFAPNTAGSVSTGDVDRKSVV